MRKGEIATLLTLSLVLVGAVVTIASSFLTNKQKNLASNPRAACAATQCTGSGGKCYNPDPNKDYGGYKCCNVAGKGAWKTSCSPAPLPVTNPEDVESLPKCPYINKNAAAVGCGGDDKFTSEGCGKSGIYQTLKCKAISGGAQPANTNTCEADGKYQCKTKAAGQNINKLCKPGVPANLSCGTTTKQCCTKPIAPAPGNPVQTGGTGYGTGDPNQPVNSGTGDPYPQNAGRTPGMACCFLKNGTVTEYASSNAREVSDMGPCTTAYYTKKENGLISYGATSWFECHDGSGGMNQLDYETANTPAVQETPPVEGCVKKGTAACSIAKNQRITDDNSVVWCCPIVGFGGNPPTGCTQRQLYRGIPVCSRGVLTDDKKWCCPSSDSNGGNPPAGGTNNVCVQLRCNRFAGGNDLLFSANQTGGLIGTYFANSSCTPPSGSYNTTIKSYCTTPSSVEAVAICKQLKCNRYFANANDLLFSANQTGGLIGTYFANSSCTPPSGSYNTTIKSYCTDPNGGTTTRVGVHAFNDNICKQKTGDPLAFCNIGIPPFNFARNLPCKNGFEHATDAKCGGVL